MRDHKPGCECRLCWLYENRPEYRKILTKALVKKGKCKFIQHELRQQECDSCSGKVKIKIFGCEIFSECTAIKKFDKIHDCQNCESFQCMNCEFDENGLCIHCGTKVEIKDTDIITKRCSVEDVKTIRDYPMSLLYDKKGNPVLHLKGMFKGCSIFYIGGGPSLIGQEHILHQLQRTRGIITFAVNNVGATLIRPNFWMCSDTPRSFHQAIWKDNFITKFVPEDKGSDIVVGTKTSANEFPNVFSYNLQRPSIFHHNKFLTEDTVNFGSEKGEKDSLGIAGGRTVFLAAVKILYYLGFKNIFLFGCDFNMEYDPSKDGKGKTYAWSQWKHEGGCNTNNDCYQKTNERCKALQLLLLQNNCHFYNCTPNSNLTAFPKMLPFDAVKLALENFPAKIDVNQMYE